MEYIICCVHGPPSACYDYYYDHYNYFVVDILLLSPHLVVVAVAGHCRCLRVRVRVNTNTMTTTTTTTLSSVFFFFLLSSYVYSILLYMVWYEW